MQNILNQIRENNNKLKDLSSQISGDNRKLLGEAAKEIFEKNSDWLQSFSWTQYTPYFNDGDTCEFGVNVGYPDINGQDEFEAGFLHESEGWGEKKKANPNFDANKCKVVKDLKELIGSLGEDNLKSIFGDHVKVTLTKDGFEVEGYDHE